MKPHPSIFAGGAEAGRRAPRRIGDGRRQPAARHRGRARAGMRGVLVHRERHAASARQSWQRATFRSFARCRELTRSAVRISTLTVSYRTLRSPGRPREATPAEQVQMDVEHRLAGVAVRVEDGPVAARGESRAPRRSPRPAGPFADQLSSSAAESLSVAICRFGTMSTCVGACGLMSLKATTRSSS